MATRQGTRWRRSPLLAEKVFLLLLSVWRGWWVLEEGDLVVMMTAMMMLTAMVMMVMAELTMQQRLGARGAAHALEKMRTTEDLVAGHLALVRGGICILVLVWKSFLSTKMDSNLILTRWGPSHEKTITADLSFINSQKS